MPGFCKAGFWIMQSSRVTQGSKYTGTSEYALVMRKYAWKCNIISEYISRMFVFIYTNRVFEYATVLKLFNTVDSLRLLRHIEAYSDHCEVSRMKYFEKIFMSTIFEKSIGSKHASIYPGWNILKQYSFQLFSKKALVLRMLVFCKAGLWII